MTVSDDDWFVMVTQLGLMELQKETVARMREARFAGVEPAKKDVEANVALMTAVGVLYAIKLLGQDKRAAELLRKAIEAGTHASGQLHEKLIGSYEDWEKVQLASGRSK
jgi:hypothetical protein